MITYGHRQFRWFHDPVMRYHMSIGSVDLHIPSQQAFLAKRYLAGGTEEAVLVAEEVPAYLDGRVLVQPQYRALRHDRETMEDEPGTSGEKQSALHLLQPRTSAVAQEHALAIGLVQYQHPPPQPPHLEVGRYPNRHVYRLTEGEVAEIEIK